MHRGCFTPAGLVWREKITVKSPAQASGHPRMVTLDPPPHLRR